MFMSSSLPYHVFAISVTMATVTAGKVTPCLSLDCLLVMLVVVVVVGGGVKWHTYVPDAFWDTFSPILEKQWIKK